MLLRDSAEWFEISQKQLQTLLGTVIKAAEELSRLFKVNIGSVVGVEDLLAEAEDRMVQIQSELERENQELRENNVSLSQQTISDPLTGVANRKHFDEELERRFADCACGSASAWRSYSATLIISSPSTTRTATRRAIVC